MKSKLNRNTVKYIAIMAMVLNHTAKALSIDGLLGTFMSLAGSITMPTMCFFLVEGYKYTRSKKKYLGRLILFSLLSQIPYSYALGTWVVNVMFTLSSCFLVLLLKDGIKDKIFKTVLVIAVICITVVSDWGIMAPMFVLFLSFAGDKKVKVALSYATLMLLHITMHTANFMASGMMVQDAMLNAGIGCIGISVSGILILFFYNGKLPAEHKKFSKWFFYLFYPVHLALLCLIKALI